MIVATPHGKFKIIRKDTVAISVIRILRAVRHHYRPYEAGDLGHVEHRKWPPTNPTLGPWAEYVATYDLKGNEIK